MKLNLQIAGDSNAAFSKRVGLRLASPYFSNVVYLDVNRPAKDVEVPVAKNSGYWESSRNATQKLTRIFVEESYPIEPHRRVDTFNIVLDPRGGINKATDNISTSLFTGGLRPGDFTYPTKTAQKLLEVNEVKSEGQESATGTVQIECTNEGIVGNQQLICNYDLTVKAYTAQYTPEILLNDSRQTMDGWEEDIYIYAELGDSYFGPSKVTLIDDAGIPGINIRPWTPNYDQGSVYSNVPWFVDTSTYPDGIDSREIVLRATFESDGDVVTHDFIIPITMETNIFDPQPVVYITKPNIYKAMFFQGIITEADFNKITTGSEIIHLPATEFGASDKTSRYEVPYKINLNKIENDGKTVSRVVWDETSPITCVSTYMDPTMTEEKTVIKVFYASQWVPDAELEL